MCVRESLQVIICNTGAATPLHLCKWQEMFGLHLPWVGTAVIGIWEEKKKKQKEKGRERVVSVSFSLSFMYDASAHHSLEHVWACDCRGTLARLGLGSTTAWLLCLISNTEQKQLNWLSTTKMSSSPPTPHRQHLHTHIPTLTASCSLKESANVCFRVQGSQQNKPRCHCLDRNATTRGERGVCVGQDRGWREGGRNICLHFPEPISPSSSPSPFSPHGQQQPQRENKI